MVWLEHFLKGRPKFMKRFFDIFLSATWLLMLILPMLAISFFVKVSSSGPILFWSDRIGRNNYLFKMPKFRTMRVDTPQLATHLLDDSYGYVTPLGSFLRKTSLDELPQLWSILIGDMSFVGPRPALFNQDDLIILRNQYGIQELLPGLTGWAQINGRDNLSIQDKVQYEVEYLRRKSFYFDLKILFLTFRRVFDCAGISH